MNIISVGTVLLFSYTLLFAHGNEVHQEKEKVKKVDKVDKAEVEVETNKKIILDMVNEEYVKNIKPIFINKCFNCHSNSPSYPFYYKVPGIKQLIDHDINEAKKHINMSGDFPFISHDTPKNDLKSIKESTINNSMPPLRYVIAHWDSKLNEIEREKIIKWIDESLKKLEK